MKGKPITPALKQQELQNEYETQLSTPSDGNLRWLVAGSISHSPRNSRCHPPRGRVKSKAGPHDPHDASSKSKGHGQSERCAWNDSQEYPRRKAGEGGEHAGGPLLRSHRRCRRVLWRVSG